MSKLEFNKVDLFQLAKKITNQKYSFPKNMSIKSTQNQPKNFLRTSYTTQNNNLNPRDLGEVNSEENNKRTIKKGIKFKNKFLEKDNIQINAEKMLHLLSERKKKMKMALNHNNDKSLKNMEKPKVIYINLDNSENRNRNDISDSVIQTRSYHERNKFKKIVKNNSNFEKGYSATNDNNNNDNGRQNESFKSKVLPKKHIYNSNSDYYDNLNRNYIPNRYSIKSMKTTSDNYNLNLRNSNTSHNSLNKNKVNNVTKVTKVNNYSRNNEKIKSNIVKHFYSLNKDNENNMDEIYEDINDKISEDEPNNFGHSNNNNQKMNNINNNININININNNINNNDINMNMNNIKKIDNKIIKNTQESFNKLLQPNKFISYRHSVYKAHNKNNNIDINSYVSEYHSFNDEKKTKDKNNLFEKIIKKYESHKIYYLKKTSNTNNTNNDKDIEEEDNTNDNYNSKDANYAEEKNKKEINFEGNNSYNLMDYNTYNINLNFISDPKKYMQNGYFGSMKYINCNKGASIPNRSKISLPKKNANVSSINSPGKAHQVYKTKPSENEEANTHINHNNSLASITKRIRKKYYKNNPKNIAAIKNNNNNIIKNINIRKSSPNNKSKTTIDKIDNNDNNSQIYDNVNNNDNGNQKKLNTNANTNTNTNMNIIKNKKDIIQLEDLLILEGKLCHLMDCLKYENPMPKMCIEWWNFYTYSSYFGKFPKLFPQAKEEDRDNNNYIISDYQIAHDSMMFELLSMIITYQILNDPKLNQNLINTLKNLINEVHQNFLIECDYILSKVNNQSLNNIWIKKLKNLILSKRNWSDNNSDKKNYHLDLIKQGNSIIQNLIQYLLSIYTRANSTNIDINSLTYFNKNISEVKLMELSGYYNRVISQENMKINKKFSYIIKRKPNDDKYVSIVVPYLPEEIEGKKKFTLVLDLDETLISFRIDEGHRGMVKMRPGLYNFLKNVGSKYELIIFTAGTQEYADPILDVIEKNRKFFAKRLYRQHTIFMNNTYIKDLTRLGRDLSKIIIVDNMPQNFGLQRENGIFIKNFFGEDKNDTALNDLTHILLKIASNPNNDVRTELKKYKEEIFTKITTNLNY